MKKVLILDDEIDLLEIWLYYFKTWDFPVEVHTALNGAEGLKMVETVGHYDLIITDYKMPILNGLDFIKLFKARNEHIPTPIFFFTGFMPELKNDIDVLDDVMIFEKPVISQKIKSHIAACLSDLKNMKADIEAT